MEKIALFTEYLKNCLATNEKKLSKITTVNQKRNLLEPTHYTAQASTKFLFTAVGELLFTWCSEQETGWCLRNIISQFYQMIIPWIFIILLWKCINLKRLVVDVKVHQGQVVFQKAPSNSSLLPIFPIFWHWCWLFYSHKQWTPDDFSMHKRRQKYYIPS